jgi:RNA polymerase sigma-70 factor (ECF subfamily)
MGEAVTQAPAPGLSPGRQPHLPEAPEAQAPGPPGGCSDADLLGEGTPASFGLLFDRHAAGLLRYCSRRLGPDLAEDVVAETFLIAYERRQRYDHGRASARPWLYGIATNLVRRQRSAEHRALRAAAGAAGAGELTVDGGYQLADRAAERIDARTLVAAMSGTLARLPAGQRDVLLMHAAGLAYADIAAALEVPIGTVMSRLHRARRRLRACLPAEIVKSYESQ